MSFDVNSSMIRDRLYGLNTEFPGYEELFQKVSQELTAARAKFLKQQHELSDEVLGEKKKFKYEEGLIDIKNILKRFNDETLKKRIVEIIKEVIQDDVVKGIRTQIIQAKFKN